MLNMIQYCDLIVCRWYLAPFRLNNSSIEAREFKNKWSLSILQITFKYYLLDDLKHLIPIIEFIADIYEKNSHPTGKYYGICCKYARITQLTVKIGFALYFGAITIITLSGTLESILRDIRKPSMVIYFPGIHEYSTAMFALLCGYNYVMVVISFLTIPPGDMLFFVIFVNISMVPAIIKGQFEELTNALQEKQMNPVQIKRRILQYIQMHRRYNEWANILHKLIVNSCTRFYDQYFAAMFHVWTSAFSNIVFCNLSQPTVIQHLECF